MDLTEIFLNLKVRFKISLLKTRRLIKLSKYYFLLDV